MGELARPDADRAGERHAVNIAAGARFRSVHVGMGVDPYQAELPTRLAKVTRHPGDGSDGDGMVAAEDQRHLRLIGGVLHHLHQTRAGVRDLR